MLLEFLGRLQRELTLTGQAIYETILAIAERVNRKVEILRHHRHASVALNDIDTVHADLGRQITTLWPRQFLSRADTTLTNDLDRIFLHALNRIHQLKATLLTIDGHIRTLKLETIHDDLLMLQQDLGRRSAGIERIPLLPGSSSIGQKVGELRFPASVRLVTIFRGPFLVTPEESLVLRAEDILIVIGLQNDLAQVSTQLSMALHATSA